MYCHEMRLELAAEEYCAAIVDDPGNLDAHTNLGITLLGLGRWDEGWQEYAHRHENTPYPNRARRTWPEWHRDDQTAGKVILLFPEQGYGDEIMAMRFARHLEDERIVRTILEVRPPLIRLARMMPGAQIEEKDGTSVDCADLSCAALDVPMVLGTTPSSIPLAGGYLDVPRQPWLDAALPRGFRVGLCWSSGQRPLQPETEPSHKMKSVPIEWLEPLRQDGVALVSLQKEGGGAAVSRLGAFDTMGDVHDFLDTAQIIAELDLVISVDTAVAHLAGAMGKPVWNLVRFNGYWPWLRDDRTTPWYSSMSLYRQPRLGDWNEPINRMAADLVELVKRKAA
jgi:hypothetical protein